MVWPGLEKDVEEEENEDIAFTSINEFASPDKLVRKEKLENRDSIVEEKFALK